MSTLKETDLVSLLSLTQRHDLIKLIANSAEQMRSALVRTCTPPETPAGPAPNSPAITSFDAWHNSVLTRMSTVLDLQHESHPHPTAATPAPAYTPASDLSFLHNHYPPLPTPLTTSLPSAHGVLILQSLLLLLLSLKTYDARSRVLLLTIASSLNHPLSTILTLERTTAISLVSAAMTADTESAERLKNADSTNRWKIGIASVAGAALVGITGGLAAPLVAAGLGAVMGGLGLGATVTAGYLGAVASSGAMMGALFGAYGGKMGGEVMERYAKEVSDFSFLPLQEGGEARLRVAVGVTGWVVDDAAEEVVAPWRVLGGGLEGYALRWEVEALTDLGKALQGILSSFAMGWVKTEIIKRTVFATLYSALWPIGLLKAAKVIDNPYFIAKARSEKAGLVLADAIIHKTQGERPITLVGFSLGARVVYTCLMSLAERGAFGLVENVVMMGSPVPASVETWRTIRTVVSGRVVNVYSGQDYILAFLYRTSSIQLGVAGLQKIDVEGVENVDLGEKGQGHLKYGLVAAGVLGELLTGDVVTVEAKKGEEFLGELVKETARKRQGVTEDQLEEKGKEDDEDVEKVVEKARRELDERRRLRQEKK